jgi:pilus assembly protein Flp/PilA
LGPSGRNKQVREMLTTLFRTLKADTSGATAVEYGLIVCLIVIGMLVSLQLVATETLEMWGIVETNALDAMGA